MSGDGLPPIDEAGMDPATLDWCAATAEAVLAARGDREGREHLAISALALHLRAAADLAYETGKTGMPPPLGGPTVHRMMAVERVCLVLTEIIDGDPALAAHPALRLALDGWVAVQRSRWNDRRAGDIDRPSGIADIDPT